MKALELLPRTDESENLWCVLHQVIETDLILTFEELFLTDIKGLQNPEINGRLDGLCEYTGKSNTHKP